MSQTDSGYNADVDAPISDHENHIETKDMTNPKLHALKRSASVLGGSIVIELDSPASKKPKVKEDEKDEKSPNSPVSNRRTRWRRGSLVETADEQSQDKIAPETTGPVCEEQEVFETLVDEHDEDTQTQSLF